MTLTRISGRHPPTPLQPSVLYTLSQGLAGTFGCLFIPPKPVLWPGTVPVPSLPRDFQGLLTQESPLPLFFWISEPGTKSVFLSISYVLCLFLSLFLHCYSLRLGTYHLSLPWSPHPSPELLSPLSHVAARAMNSLI